MKKFLYIILLFTCTINILAQEYYYYYDKGKINLSIDSTTIVMIFNDKSNFKNRESNFILNKEIKEYNVSDGMEDANFARLKFNHPINNILEELKKYQIYDIDLETYSYGFITKNNNEIWATNEIIIYPINNMIEENIIKLLNEYKAVYYDKDKYGTYFFKVTNSYIAFNLAAKLVEQGLVEYAEPVFKTNIKLFDDPLYNEQYYLNNTGQLIDGSVGIIDMDIDAPEAWTITKGNNIRVAVIDDGVDLCPVHEDLLGNVLSGYTPNCKNNCDGRPQVCSNHGQAVAGIIAANHNNIGIKGIAPNIKIVPFRIFECNNYGNTIAKTNKDIGEAINKAWDNFYCDILSNSWGGGSPSNYITNAIDNAYNYGRGGKGCIIVFSAGNSYSSVAYPARLPNVLAVGAIDKYGIITNYSCYGNELDITAFGGYSDIRTTDRMGNTGYANGNYYNNFGGTSAACPQVSAVAALLLSIKPDLTAEQVYCRLKSTALDVGFLGYDIYYGSGILNAYRTVAYNNMYLHNKIFSGLQDFWSANTLNVDNVIFKNTSNITLRAGQYIKITSGHIENGSTFHAYIDEIDPCSNTNNRSLDNTYYQNILSEKMDVFNYNNISIPDLDFMVIPNPNDGNFSLKILKDIKYSYYLDILNIYGISIYQLNNIYKNEINVNLVNINDGIYFIRLMIEDKIYIKKLVIQ